MISLEDKKRGIALITEAIMAGASTKKSCETLGISKSTFIRWSSSCEVDNRHGPLSEPKNKYSIEEKRMIIDVCTSKEFCDIPPCQIVPSLADQGLFVGSESTFYKVLHEFEMQKKRSNKSSHKRKKPKELVATEPNQVWSWDITYLPAEIRGKFYYLYLIMDIFSRKIVGSKVYEKECMSYSAELIEMTCIVEDVKKDRLTLHSDNGGPMKGSTMLAKLQDLKVASSFSRPSVSNDNPYSESIFGTMKYCPMYPQRPFSSIDEARSWVSDFVAWYNFKHLHSGIKFVTPNDKHNGNDIEILAKRKIVYLNAQKKRPERWSKEVRNWEPVLKVDLNPLKEKAQDSIMIEALV